MLLLTPSKNIHEKTEINRKKYYILLVCTKLDVEKCTYFVVHGFQSPWEKLTISQLPFYLAEISKCINQAKKQKSMCFSLKASILHENCRIPMYISLSKAKCVATY